MPFLVPGHPVVFAHVPKTGGTWTRRALALEKVHGEHGPPSQVAYLLDTHSVVAQIRDPWSWYASLYAHLIHMGRVDDLAAWGDGDPSWAAVLQGWTDTTSTERPSRILGLPLAAPGAVGLWSRVYETFLGDRPATLIDLAAVAAGWAELLDTDSSDMPAENTRGSAAAYRKLYTKAQRERVRKADSALIKACGYSFLGKAKSGPLMAWPIR